MIVECNDCRRFVDANPITSYERLGEGQGPSRLISLLRCPGCSGPILAGQMNIGNMADGDRWDTPFIIYPSDVGANPNAPRDIQAAYLEALNCFRAAAYTASAIMCRKTLEGMCVAHGINERNLARSLEAMRDQGLIDDRLFQWSDVLRHAGNEAAHGVGLTVSAEDAKDIIEFTGAIVDYLFSFRDRFEAFNQRRQQRQNQP